MLRHSPKEVYCRRGLVLMWLVFLIACTIASAHGSHDGGPQRKLLCGGILQSACDTISSGATSVGNAGTAAYTGATHAATNAANSAGNAGTAAYTGASHAVNSGASSAGNAGTAAYSGATHAATNAANSAGNAGTAAYNGAKSTGNNQGNAATSAYSNAGNAANNAANKVDNYANSHGVNTAMKEGGKVVDGVSAVGSAAQALGKETGNPVPNGANPYINGAAWASAAQTATQKCQNGGYLNNKGECLTGVAACGIAAYVTENPTACAAAAGGATGAYEKCPNQPGGKCLDGIGTAAANAVIPNSGTTFGKDCGDGHSAETTQGGNVMTTCLQKTALDTAKQAISSTSPSGGSQSSPPPASDGCCCWDGSKNPGKPTCSGSQPNWCGSGSCA